jgi:chitodextrinase
MITGTNFENVSKVSFYDTPTAYAVLSTTQIAATVPAGTPSPGRWRVHTPAGVAVSADTFTVAPDRTRPSTPGTLSATDATAHSVSLAWSPSSDNVGVVGYRVYVGETAMGSATGTSYTMTGLDCGTTYTFGVEGEDDAGNLSDRARVFAATDACVGDAPSSTALPTISGSAVVGKVLSASGGSWSGTTPLTRAYRWQRCDATGAACTAITGATKSTYSLVAADRGKTLRVRVTVTNTAGSASARSKPTNPVQASATAG